jgi:AraC-like DNA-binding protein
MRPNSDVDLDRAAMARGGETMPSCATESFSDPSEYAAAIRGAEVNLTLIRGGCFSARITTFDLPGLRAQRFSERIPRVLHVAKPRDVEFLFHTRPGPGFIQNGLEVTARNVARRGPLRSYDQRSSGPICWGGLSLPEGNALSLESTVTGRGPTSPPDELIFTPAPAALRKLRHLHATAGRIAQETPDMIDNSELARGVEQILLQALANCLDTNDIQRQTATQRRHHAIIERFHEVLSADPERPVYVMEMAVAVGASLRSLSECCQEHLGMGPKKYLLLRRMHLARQALREANPRTTTVTDVATQHGFWQFGRFAGEYKRLFGELPSTTMRQAKAQPRAPC